MGSWMYLEDSDQTLEIDLTAMCTDLEDEEYRIQGVLICYVCSTNKKFIEPVPTKYKRAWLGCDYCGVALVFDFEKPRGGGKVYVVDLFKRP